MKIDFFASPHNLGIEVRIETRSGRYDIIKTFPLGSVREVSQHLQEESGFEYTKGVWIPFHEISMIREARESKAKSGSMQQFTYGEK